jgi:hypothetical protein
MTGMDLITLKPQERPERKPDVKDAIPSYVTTAWRDREAAEAAQRQEEDALKERMAEIAQAHEAALARGVSPRSILGMTSHGQQKRPPSAVHKLEPDQHDRMIQIFQAHANEEQAEVKEGPLLLTEIVSAPSGAKVLSQVLPTHSEIAATAAALAERLDIESAIQTSGGKIVRIADARRPSP